jgi:hypothetical protein
MVLNDWEMSFIVALIVLGQRQGAVLEVSKWTSLFNEKDLSGWSIVNGTASYKVEDGAIVGRTQEGSPNSFLATSQDFSDFELEFETKMDSALNSGVQIRSRNKTAEDVKTIGGPVGRYCGPQIEIESAPGQAAFVYGEAVGPGWISPEPENKDPKISTHSYFKNDQWNRYRVIAVGPRIVTYLNGYKVADVTSPTIYQSHSRGSVGLQVHSIAKGTGPFKVAWRKIRIREYSVRIN